MRLPGPGEGPLDHLLPEARWREMLAAAPGPEDWLAALSQASGVYFFPSREWPGRLVRWLRRLKVARLLEAGAGRGYLSAALGPLCAAAGISFLAVDRGQGEFVADLPAHPLVQPGDAFQAVQDWRPDLLLYAWPPPGQSVEAMCRAPGLHYVVVVGEAGGGVTGAPEDWQTLRHRDSPALRRFGRGRTGPARHRVTVFW